jgi:predicted amidohydrolase
MADVQGDIEATVSRVKKYAQEADRLGVDVLCFPECYLQGYTRDERIARKRALGLDGNELAARLRELQQIDCTLILGLIEAVGDDLFNTAAVVKEGSIVGFYRKAHPNEAIFKAGASFPVFTLDARIFGINICNDANYPAAADRLTAQGAHIIFYPLNNRLLIETAERWRHKHIQNLIDRAKQTNCWIVSADIVWQDDKTIGYGCTAIVQPGGEVVARAPELREQMIIASLS